MVGGPWGQRLCRSVTEFGMRMRGARTEFVSEYELPSLLLRGREGGAHLGVRIRQA